MKPSDLLDVSRIVLGVESSMPRDALLRRLTGVAVGSAANHHEAIASELIAREAKMTTGIGQGVAIPHTRTAYVDHPVAALAVSREGVDFRSLDGEPVHIVFAFVTPKTTPRSTSRHSAPQPPSSPTKASAAASSPHPSPGEILEILRSSGG